MSWLLSLLDMHMRTSKTSYTYITINLSVFRSRKHLHCFLKLNIGVTRAVTRHPVKSVDLSERISWIKGVGKKLQVCQRHKISWLKVLEKYIQIYWRHRLNMEEDKIFSAATIQIHSAGYTTPKAMKVAGFSEDECSNLALRKRIQRQMQQILHPPKLPVPLFRD